MAINEAWLVITNNTKKKIAVRSTSICAKFMGFYQYIYTKTPNFKLRLLNLNRQGQQPHCPAQPSITLTATPQAK